MGNTLVSLLTMAIYILQIKWIKSKVEVLMLLQTRMSIDSKNGPVWNGCEHLGNTLYS